MLRSSRDSQRNLAVLRKSERVLSRTKNWISNFETDNLCKSKINRLEASCLKLKQRNNEENLEFKMPGFLKITKDRRILWKKPKYQDGKSHGISQFLSVLL